jgi:hypothetical protein
VFQKEIRVVGSWLLRVLKGPVTLFPVHPAAGALLIVLSLLLTAVTQIGGVLLWLETPVLHLMSRRMGRFGWLAGMGVFVMTYLAVMLLAVPPVAARFGRVPLPCSGAADAPLQPVSLAFCLLGRNYVTPGLRQILEDTASTMHRAYPGRVLRYMDGGFPFFDGFPLLPHLSHDDGRKIDLAFYYRDVRTGKALQEPPSPIGYWAYEGPGIDEVRPCTGKRSWLRWDLTWFQPFFRNAHLDPEPTRVLVDRLSRSTAVQTIFIEPHLKRRLGLHSSKIRFQGCQAARHDDHIHVSVNR